MRLLAKPRSLMESLVTAGRTRRLPIVVGFWDQAVRKAPALRLGHIGLARGLRMSGQLDRAQEVIGFAVDRFPGDAQVLAEAARVEAAWDAFEPLAPIKVAAIVNERQRRLLLGFESVGVTCEFGLVQRRYGAEPLGLFRWNTVPPRALLRGLAEGLAGLGEPENTEVYQARSGEFLLRDRRWGYGMHTWMYPSQIDEADLHLKMCRRLAFLRDKFMEDLRLSEKIFVYRSIEDNPGKMQELHDALRAHGPAKLLAVLPCDPRESARDVVQARDGLCVAYLRPGMLPVKWDIPFQGWVATCERASVLFEGGR